MIKISIIIVNYNTSDLLNNCLLSIKKNSGNLFIDNNIEIIVIDNGSSDESLTMLNKNFPEVSIIKNNLNIGFGSANNQGIKKTKGEYVLMLNSDIEVLDNGIIKIMDFIVNNKKADFVGGKLYDLDGKKQASCGPFYSLPVIFALLFLKGDKLFITRYSPEKNREVDWVSGACLLGKKETFNKVGLFDEKIFMYMDDIEYLYRARNLGLNAFFCKDAKFIHIGSGSSIGKTNPIINIYKGLIYFYKKYKSPQELALLKIMLKLKANIVIMLGKLTNNGLVVKTYEKALGLV